MPKMRKPASPARDAVRANVPSWLGEVIAPENIDATDLDLMGTSIAAPLITRFGSVAERAMSTDRALKALKEMFPQHLGGALDTVAKRYPRVLGHSLPSESYALPYNGVAHTSAKGVVPVELNAEMLKSQPIDALETLYHELTHVAQTVGNKDFNELYNLMGSGLEGHRLAGTKPAARRRFAYTNNPFEQSARDVAARKTGRMPPGPAARGRRPATDTILQWANTVGPLNAPTMSLHEAADIVKRRKAPK